MRLLAVITDLASAARFLRSPRRADRAPHPRSRSSPAVLAEQDCTTPRPIRAVLAARVVRRALNGDCTDPGKGKGGRLAHRRPEVVRAAGRPRPIAFSAGTYPAPTLTPLRGRARRGVLTAPQLFHLHARRLGVFGEPLVRCFPRTAARGVTRCRANGELLDHAELLNAPPGRGVLVQLEADVAGDHCRGEGDCCLRGTDDRARGLPESTVE